MIDIFDNNIEVPIILDAEENSTPIVTAEEEKEIKKLYNTNPLINPDLNAWIQTYTKKRFSPLNPKTEDIDIEDIAHALSNLCRFTGHCSQFYSVAQHCVLVSYLCDSADALHGLLHDGSEAYCQDIPAPLKRSYLFEGYRQMETKVQELIYLKFNLGAKEPVSVKKADLMLLATEGRDLLGPLRPDWKVKENPLPFKIMPLGPTEAKQLFLHRFYELTIK